jgi:lysozyme family protein
MAQYQVSTLRPEYLRYWNTMKLTRPTAANRAANRIIANRARYKVIEARTGVPWYVVGLMHLRESDFNFNTWLHNGDPMRNKAGQLIRTVRVPEGYPKVLKAGMTFEDGAYDALVTVKGFDKIKVWDIAQIAYVNESYNGFGYRHPARNIPSPYLWGGTTIQKRGKFIRDRVYDAGTWDDQLGVMAVLRALFDIEGITVPGDKNWVKPAPVPPEQAPPPPPLPPTAPPANAPKAEEPLDAGVRPASKSVSVWGTLFAGISGVAGVVSSAFAYINNPYALTAFGILLFVIILGVILQVRGYIDVRKVVMHLNEDRGGGNEPTG